jgi:hypothetical protein
MSFLRTFYFTLMVYLCVMHMCDTFYCGETLPGVLIAGFPSLTYCMYSEEGLYFCM